MGMSRLNLPTLLMAFIGGLVALYDAQGLVASLAGLTLLTAVVAYDERGARSSLQSLVFAFVCGLAVLCTISYPLHALLGDSGLAILPLFLAKEISAAIWMIATLILWFVDRARMNSRQSLSLRSPTMPVIAYQQAPQPVRENRIFAPIAQQAVPSEPADVRPIEPEYAAPLSVPTESSPIPSAAVPVPSGKEVSIYVNMLDEGMNVLRAVRAEHLGRDFYIIVDVMPVDEKWEYVPGQVVRCRKKNLSNGKGLVAYEEAPRAQ